MPNLVNGHLRYTEEDFLYSDLNQKIVEYITGEEKETPIESIVDILHEELDHLAIVVANYKHLPQLLNLTDDSSAVSSRYVKEEAGFVLAETLEYFLTLARKCDFTLEDLIKISNSQ